MRVPSRKPGPSRWARSSPPEYRPPLAPFPPRRLRRLHLLLAPQFTPPPPLIQKTRRRMLRRASFPPRPPAVAVKPAAPNASRVRRKPPLRGGLLGAGAFLRVDVFLDIFLFYTLTIETSYEMISFEAFLLAPARIQNRGPPASRPATRSGNASVPGQGRKAIFTKTRSRRFRCAKKRVSFLKL